MFTLAWVLVGVAAAVIEGLALVNRRRGDTLTENFRRVIAINRFTRLVVFLTWCWLTAHLWLPGGWI